MKKQVIFMLLTLFIFAILGLFLIYSKGKNTKQEQKEEKVTDINIKGNPEKSLQEKIIINSKLNYKAILKTTVGEMTISLNTKQTPITVNNFVSLAKKNFYDKTIFHRVIKGFMIQGGDPKGDGTGGPGYTFADEPFGGEYKRGTIAMANSGPDTNGSQFFIMHKDYPLPKNYVIFGQLTDGLETLDKIAEGQVVLGESGEISKPVEPVKIQSVEIIEE